MLASGWRIVAALGHTPTLTSAWSALRQPLEDGRVVIAHETSELQVRAKANADCSARREEVVDVLIVRIEQVLDAEREPRATHAG